MHRLPLILCLIALAGSGASAILYFEIGNSKQVLEQQLADSNGRASRLEHDLAGAHRENGALKARLEATDSELESTRGKLDASTAHATELERDLTQAKTVLGFYESTARGLSDEVGSLRHDLSEARNSNASPEAVAAYKKTIAELEKQLADARNGAAAPALVGGSTAVFTSRLGRATVLTVGPENAFVVLNFGAARGARLGQKLAVNRGTDTVATVSISDVRANFSIAQVLPDTLRGGLRKGDSAVLIR